MKLPQDRFEFSAIQDRPRWNLPDGKRMAVYLVVNVEQWDISRPVPREYVTSPAAVATVPNIPNWAWHEYGMRVGIWRLMNSLAVHGVKASAAINATVFLGHAARVADAMLEAGWEFMGHGFDQAALHTAPDQRQKILDAFRLLTDQTGIEPKGWLGPGLQETLETLDFLAEAGFKYVTDWPMDEQPVTMRTSAGPIVAMPYTLELSDLPMMVVHHHESRAWTERVIDQFDRLYEDSLEQPRVMSMSVHPYIIGVPHRIKHFERAIEYVLGHKDVWFATAGEIYDWYSQSAP